jgi:hypothetical protein
MLLTHTLARRRLAPPPPPFFSAVPLAFTAAGPIHRGRLQPQPGREQRGWARTLRPRGSTGPAHASRPQAHRPANREWRRRGQKDGRTHGVCDAPLSGSGDDGRGHVRPRLARSLFACCGLLDSNVLVASFANCLGELSLRVRGSAHAQLRIYYLVLRFFLRKWCVLSLNLPIHEKSMVGE